VSEATPCVLIIFLMFVIPRNPTFPFFGFHDPATRQQPAEPSRSLLSWQIIHEKLPWNVVILMGTLSQFRAFTFTNNNGTI
jgi:sodium-dependent dicarboxylate transporter 2/3/5